MIFSSAAAGNNSKERRRTPLRTGLAIIATTMGSGALGATPGAATQTATPATASPALSAPATTQPLDPSAAARFAGLALSCLHKEYPNKIAHVMESDADALPPHTLTPAFYGCFDWHSDVHGHWLLVRLAHLYPNAAFASQARAELARSFTPENIAGELAYMKREDRASFERPYGLAWLLQLSSELRQWNDPQAKQWSTTLQPLETEAATHLKSWLPKLHYPIRIGEHDQTAFSFGLVWDWAGVANDAEMRRLLADAARRFYQNDRNCPLSYEPSGQDFPVALPRRSGLHAQGVGQAGLPRMAEWLSSGHSAQSGHAMAATGCRHRPRRPKARSHRRPESEPRVDARRNRARRGSR